MANTPDNPHGYRTSPDQETTGWPPGVPYIIGNEACERFSFYGMRAILILHLVSLFVIAGQVQEEAARSGKQMMHLFMAGVYALPMIGALIADRFAGKYRTILILSLVYCGGHAVLAVGEGSLMGMGLGLALIAVGSGGIKPCVSANVGDQFGKGNWFRVRTVFQIFYFSINFGSFFATLAIPTIKKHSGDWVAAWFPGWVEGWTPEQLSSLGTSIAFGIPGVLMFLATFIFWLGRKKFVHIPPRPGGKVGLLDALSSVSLFLSVGHLFISPELVRTALALPKDEPLPGAAWATLAALSVVFLAAGVALFRYRQRLMPDDGFLSITLYSLGQFFGIQALSRAALGGRESFPNLPTEPTALSDPDAEALRRSSFWGPATRVFGTKATEGPVAVFKIISVFFLVSIFWALFDQHSSTWILQAKAMDRTYGAMDLGPLHIQPGELDAQQIPALNPLMVMILIPLMNLLYGWSDRMGLKTTPLRRITVGMFLSALSFVAVALIQKEIDLRPPQTVPIAWQLIPYWLITIGEVMVSITGLEFAYTQAPRRMKSTVMGFWLLTVSLGNVLVAILAGFKGLSDENFYWVFAGLMAGAGLIFGLRAFFYRAKDYTQE